MQKDMESTRQGTDVFFLVNGKILSRGSSVGCSSRANYYCRSSGGVPFEWEREPGTPKELPCARAPPLQPLSPPPSVVSLALPKPCMEDTEDEKSFSVLSSLKRVIKKYQSKMMSNKSQNAEPVEDLEDRFCFWSPERDDFEGSSAPGNSSSSSLVSASLSFSGGGSPEREAATYHHHHHQAIISCIPLKISSIMDYVTKRRG